MAKERIHYQCSACAALHSKWAGQCGDCGEWNSLSEVTNISTGPGPAQNWAGQTKNMTTPVAIADVETSRETRQSTGINELDRVLGDGLVSGSVVLLGGDPGIGKSTILLQMQASLTNSRCLYVTGEESLQQVSMRAQRLKLKSDNIRLLSETRIENILQTALTEKPDIIVIDSIQTAYTEAVQSAPGSVSQVRESTARLVRYAKQTQTTLFLVGHVTKDGQLAGPRVLEHMVDTVLYFEGEQGSRYRMIRAVKNRFGAVNELGIFAMTETGLKAVSNPSAIFLSRHETPVPGSVIMVTREGTRPLLVEIQALVAESRIANPRRVSVGLEQNRLAMMLAVLQRHGGFHLYDQDVFVNAVGGVRINETASDLALVLAILSSFRDKPLPTNLIVFGEIGLSGELRPVTNGQDRLKEAAKHGFKNALIPKANLGEKTNIKGLNIIAVNTLSAAIDALEQF
ncbi:MAG: DNA repair protein RadA [Gammaproteobacteria bacterium]|nr:DNA repair protein RadA [Gammaproteobacteria bacterium]